MNLCWNNVFVICCMLTGTLGAILNYHNLRGLYTVQTREIFWWPCFMFVYSAWILFGNDVLVSTCVEQESKPYSCEVCFLSYVNIIWTRNEFACCHLISNSYEHDMTLICLDICALQGKNGIHVFLTNSKWILLGSHLGYFLQVQLYRAVHIWNVCMVENGCQVWKQQYAQEISLLLVL